MVWLFATGCIIGAAPLVYFVVSPLAVPLGNDIKTARAMRSFHSENVAVRPVISWDMDLRRPLVEPATAKLALAAPSPETSAANPTLQVLGTIVEPGHSIVLVRGDRGQTELLAVGDLVNGARIAEVSDLGVVVICDGKRLSLAIEPPTPVLPQAGREQQVASLTPPSTPDVSLTATAADGASAADDVAVSAGSDQPGVLSDSAVKDLLDGAAYRPNKQQ